jgi:transcriptional regulator with XRE-family HTH domain
MKTLDEKMAKLGAARRRKVEACAAELIAEEMSLRNLRRAHKRTQASLAKVLNISQDQVSRLEQRSDLLLSTMRKYVEGLGGTLTLVAEFPDRPPVVLSGVTAVEKDPKAERQRKREATDKPNLHGVARA